jgi:hypothetical protein
MNYNLAKISFTGLAAAFFIFSSVFLVSCAPKRVKIVYEKEGNSEYSKSDHKHKKKGPPAHAPAHGYRAKHQYRYYPSSSVYYDSERKIYFYLKGDNWEVGVTLPKNIRLRLGDYVSIEMNTDKPYTHYADHVKRYPPGQMKKNNKKKNKWS